MKKFTAILLTWLLALTGVMPALAQEAQSTSVLVVYFSRVGNSAFTGPVDASSSASIVLDGDRALGNVGVMAEHIAQMTGGDLVLIETVDKYPASYDETLDVAADQLDEGYRPALNTTLDNLDQYDTVFLGYPNWWGDLPMAVYAFLEENPLSGKTVIPFASSGSSGFSGTQRTLARLLPDCTLLEGLHLAGSRVTGGLDQIDSWLSGLNLG